MKEEIASSLFGRGQVTDDDVSDETPLGKRQRHSSPSRRTPVVEVFASAQGAQPLPETMSSRRRSTSATWFRPTRTGDRMCAAPLQADQRTTDVLPRPGHGARRTIMGRALYVWLGRQ